MLHRQFSELVDSISDQIISYHETIILTVILQDTHSHNWTDHRPFFEVTWLPLCYYCLHLCIPGMKNVFKKNVWVLKNDGIPISSRVELSGLNRGHQIVSHSRLKTPLQFFLVLRGHHWLNSYWPCLACVASAIIVEREVWQRCCVENGEETLLESSHPFGAHFSQKDHKNGSFTRAKRIPPATQASQCPFKSFSLSCLVLNFQPVLRG